jgi:hypothetical protein
MMDRRNRLQTLLPAFLLHFFVSIPVSSSLVKSFRRVSFPSANNVNLCVTDLPSLILTKFELQDFMQRREQFVLWSEAPVDALCAYRCTAEPNCTDFVFRTDVQQCHLYYSSPIACNVRWNCIYYTVSSCQVLSRVKAHCCRSL